MKTKSNNSDWHDRYLDKFKITPNKGIEEFVDNEIILERKRIFKDLIKIADKGEIEDLRREVTSYFKGDR